MKTIILESLNNVPLLHQSYETSRLPAKFRILSATVPVEMQFKIKINFGVPVVWSFFIYFRHADSRVLSRVVGSEGTGFPSLDREQFPSYVVGPS